MQSTLIEVLIEVEVRALCRSFEFFQSILNKSGLHGPCVVPNGIVMLEQV